jgi:hypothetical protein
MYVQMYLHTYIYMHMHAHTHMGTQQHISHVPQGMGRALNAQTYMCAHECISTRAHTNTCHMSPQGTYCVQCTERYGV